MRFSSYSKVLVVLSNPFVMVVVVVGLACLGSVLSDVASDMREECAVALMPLFSCLTFMQGNAGVRPSGDCCNGMALVLRSLKCACGLVKDGPSAYINVSFTYNPILSVLIAPLCHFRTNTSKCIELLKLSPNSSDARKFKQIANVIDGLPISDAASPTSVAFVPHSLETYDHTECIEFLGCHKHMILVTGLASTTTLAIVFIGFLMCKKHMLSEESLSKNIKETLSETSGVKSTKLFGGKDIKKATSSFSTTLLLGSGGFGDVYKGCLEDGTTVAVKVAKKDSTKSTEQVLNELRILSQVNHRCLVRLLGCCIELDQPILVYEFIPNGTLYEHIHTDRFGFLNWQQRLKIAHQAAQGLAYLHTFARPPIYHRDVKSSNILLDEKSNAKVSDFGLSRLIDEGHTHVSTCLQGTMGYLDPEYYRTYHLTDKSDVYSFGVVLLELLTSQKAIDCQRNASEISLVVYVQHQVNENTNLGALDRNLITDGNLEKIKGLCSLAIRCLHDKRKDRPSMKEVVEEIGYMIGMESIKDLVEEVGCVSDPEPVTTSSVSLEKEKPEEDEIHVL